MGKDVISYMDFAENDYMFFKSAYSNGLKGGALAAMGQNICERYLKHVISEYPHPENDTENRSKESALRTHSLHRLLHYIESDMGIGLPEEAIDAMSRIDGFYFSTRYPGDDCFIPNERDIDKAYEAIEYARDITHQICKLFEEPEIAPERPDSDELER